MVFCSTCIALHGLHVFVLAPKGNVVPALLPALLYGGQCHHRYDNNL